MDKYIHEIAKVKRMRSYKLVLTISIFLLSINVKAAEKAIIRHVHGMKSIGIHGGIAALGKTLYADYSYHLTNNWQIKVGLGTEFDRLQKNTYLSVFTQPVFAYTLYSSHKYFFSQF